MDPRHSSCGSMAPLVVLTTLSISAAIDCAPPPEISRPDEPAGAAAGIRRDAVTP